MDYYDIIPKGMDAYMSQHSRHFSKPLLEWAVSKMRTSKGERGVAPDRQQVDAAFKTYGLELKRDDGYYDPCYVWAMAKSDYYSSSLRDEEQLARYVIDYIDDVDGNPTRAFDEFYINCVAKGIDIPWEDMI